MLGLIGTVLKVNCFKEAFLRGLKGLLVNWQRTRDKFQVGMPLRPLGLSPWKLSNSQIRFSSLIISIEELPNLSAMAVL